MICTKMTRISYITFQPPSAPVQEVPIEETAKRVAEARKKYYSTAANSLKFK
jgi:hypothetical protein